MVDFYENYIANCKHEHVYENYIYFESCPTPYCTGYFEQHCKDCGRYFGSCGCGFLTTGSSGWSGKRWKKFLSRKRISFNWRELEKFQEQQERM